MQFNIYIVTSKLRNMAMTILNIYCSHEDNLKTLHLHSLRSFGNSKNDEKYLFL